jgi:hypothetical protein
MRASHHALKYLATFVLCQAVYAEGCLKAECTEPM